MKPIRTWRGASKNEPGTIRVEILPAIPSGLDKVAFHAVLQEQIETARNRLLAEHLDCSISDVDVAIEDAGLVRAVDRLNHRPRGLRPFDVGKSGGPFRLLPGTRFLDPVRIFRLPWPFR